MQKRRKRISPLSKQMLTLLMECHEREILKQEPYLYGTHRSQSLLSRGLLAAKKYTSPNGKEVMALFITDLGRQVLDRI